VPASGTGVFQPYFWVPGDRRASHHVSASWGRFGRKAGALARRAKMVISAAAQQWLRGCVLVAKWKNARVVAATLRHRPIKSDWRLGSVGRTSGKNKICRACQIPALKDPKDYKYIGKPMKRLDTACKGERQGPLWHRRAACRIFQHAGRGRAVPVFLAGEKSETNV